MASTVFDDPTQRERTGEVAPLPGPLGQNGHTDVVRRPDVFQRSLTAAGGGRAVRPTLGSYAGVSDDLERRSREWTAMIRVLDQNRQALDSAELERDAAYDELARIVPVVQETGKQLKAAMDATRQGQASPELPELFARNGEALDQLEKVAVALSGHFLRCRTTWEQYARSVENAQRLRADAPRVL